MPGSNVWISITDPDPLIAGTSPFAPFAVSHIQLYRFTTEGDARANDALLGTLVTSFALIAASEAVTAEAGPFRFGYYDASQVAASWYAFRFRDSGSLNFSAFSDPWKADNRPSWTLKDLMYEVAAIIDPEVRRGTATAGAAATITCTALFKSTVRDARWYKGWYVYIDADAAGGHAAPEKDERIVSSVDTATGIATVDNDFSASPANGDTFQLHAYAAPSEIIRAINRVRERMYVLVNHDIALDQTSGAGNRYPLPPGVVNEADVIDVLSVTPYQSSDWEAVRRERYTVEFDGFQGWLYLDEVEPGTNTVRVRYEKSLRDLEGELAVMTDTTRAPIQWLRKAAAWEVYRGIDETDAAAATFARMAAITEDEVRRLSARYAPNIVRRLNTGRRQRVGPYRRGI